MAKERALKVEIDRCLKKVIEGQEVFEDLWVQVKRLAWSPGLRSKALTGVDVSYRSMNARTAISARSWRLS